MAFDISQFQGIKPDNFRYNRQLRRIKDKKHSTANIEETIDRSISQIVNKEIRSFVIFGEPQSGKTEMMICLTARILDAGKQIVIILLNDNSALLKQNLERFRKSGIDPAPKDFTDILDPHIEIGNKKWVIFCKKNASNLRKLISKVGDIEGKVIIDDEADCATPNSKVNQGEVTRIHDLVGKLYDAKGTYIGVTATPARLDLNNTYNNANDCWVIFKSHEAYTGQNDFFPTKLEGKLPYNLNTFSDDKDEKECLREAFFSFLVTVGHLNSQINDKEQNYSFLVHTSAKKKDHADDHETILEILNVLGNPQNEVYEKYVKMLWEIALSKYGTEENANKILLYILSNIARNAVVVMNSDKKASNWDTVTSPSVPFSVAIGGNIVSRGITFNRLLSMFFTREVKGKFQQDTYIQRARMFGSRTDYLKHFELWIPESLFEVWRRCFVLHRLSLESIKAGSAPIWREDGRIVTTSSSSIDKTVVSIDRGEMGFGTFDYDSGVSSMVSDAYAGKGSKVDTIKSLKEKLGNQAIPDFLLDYVNSELPDGEDSIAIHMPGGIQNYTDADQESIERPRGFIGKGDREESKFPKAIHHFKILYNGKNKARMYYKYVGNIRFLRNLKGDAKSGASQDGERE